MAKKRSRPVNSPKKPASGSSRSPRKGGKGRQWGSWRLPLLLLGAVVILAGMLWLARHEETVPPVPAQSPVPARIDQSVVAREQAEAFLAATNVPADAISRAPEDSPRQYQVRRPAPAAKSIEQLRQRLRRLEPALSLTTPEDGVLAIVDGHGQSLLVIQYLPPPPPPPKASLQLPAKGGKVVIIMDDLGRGTHQAKQLLAIRQMVTFSVLPGEPHAAEVARMAQAAGREVMLHVPMEPQGYPVVDPGDDALLTNQASEELRSRMSALLDRVPHVAGANNHMGSRFTEDERAMQVVMDVLHERGLFFVDSLTSGHSVGSVTAQHAGVPVLRRDVFLDNVAEVGLITTEIRRLAAKARRNGSAVGICHPYPETLQALRQELPKLAEQGVRFVTVSELLKGG